jgi:N utilization substance protein B
MKSRRACREATLQVLYQCDLRDDFSASTVDFFFEHFATAGDVGDGETVEVGGDYCRTLVNGVIKYLTEIDNTIGLASTNWSVARMTAIDRNIIRIGVFEIHFSDDVPTKVSINEAIEIAKDFGSDDSPKFVNGVLDRVATLPKREATR